MSGTKYHFCVISSKEAVLKSLLDPDAIQGFNVSLSCILYYTRLTAGYIVQAQLAW